MLKRNNDGTLAKTVPTPPQPPTYFRRKMKTPTTKAPETYCPYETSEGETNDPSFIPLNEAEEGDMEAEPWVRREKKEQKMRTPEVVVIAEREKVRSDEERRTEGWAEGCPVP